MGGPHKRCLSHHSANEEAVYGFVDRQNFEPTLSVFDFANPNIHAPKRVETTVPQQALFALNDPFVIERSQKLAQDSIESNTGNPSSQSGNDLSFIARILSRKPTKPRKAN